MLRLAAGVVVGIAARRIIAAALIGGAGLCPAFAQEAPSTVAELARLPKLQPDVLVPDDPGLLFFIHLSVTPKTVVYAARFSGPGRLSQDQPVDVYWRRFNGEGGRSALSLVESKLAYGVRTQAVPEDPNAVYAEIAGYPRRVLRIGVGRDGRSQAIIRMGNHQARLVYANVQIDSSAVVPKVVWVDVFGIDTASGRALKERIEPSGGRAVE